MSDATVFQIIGAVTMLVGVGLFAKDQRGGDNKVTVGPLTLALSAPSLIVFVIGALLVIFPFSEWFHEPAATPPPRSARIPDRCIAGFVWRNAYPGDHVCVVPERRAEAADDNRQAEARRDPNGAYGPNSCKQGFVWRVARPDDLVCVTPDRRTEAAEDNAQASARRAH